MNKDICDSSESKAHDWRPWILGGYKCIYCLREWPSEPSVDPDEIEAHRFVEPEHEPLWPKVVGVVMAILVIAFVFGTVGVK